MSLHLAIANANETARRWVSEPLTWCTKCPHAHDASASCAGVAAARERGLRIGRAMDRLDRMRARKIEREEA